MSKDNNLSPFQIKKQLPTSLGIWHWSNVVIMALLLLSVLLVKTLFGGKENFPLIQSALQKKGVIISMEDAKTVAKLYTHKLWDWHVYFGYVLTGLLLLRIGFEFMQRKEVRFMQLFTKASKRLRSKSSLSANITHYFFKQCLYLLFYIDLIMMVSTGLFIKFSDDYPDLKKIRSSIKDIHNIGMYVLLAFIVLHLVGLLFWEIKKSNSVRI